MSFSGSVKEELTRQTGGGRTAVRAELAALTVFCRFRSMGDEGAVLQSDQRGTLERFRTLTDQLYGAGTAGDIQILTAGRRKQYAAQAAGPAGRELSDLRAGFCADSEAPGFLAVPWTEQRLLKKETCRRAFLRGAFLAAGSMSDPNRSYHFEIICTDARQAGQLRLLLASLQTEAGQTVRRGQIIVYVKESDRIARLLGLMDARLALLEYENIRILREMRGNINRQVNCETANIGKTASAAAQQIEDIRYIESRIGLDELTNGLDEMAAVRLQYPTATLKELGSYLDPPIGKSGVNHRLRKLSEIAGHLRGN